MERGHIKNKNAKSKITIQKSKIEAYWPVWPVSVEK
jgi:hypothetical protein